MMAKTIIKLNLLLSSLSLSEYFFLVNILEVIFYSLVTLSNINQVYVLESDFSILMFSIRVFLHYFVVFLYHVYRQLL